MISKPNGGHGSAINTGMDNAVGEYVKVLDSDDWVNEKGFVTLVENLEKAEADIVWTNFFWVYEQTGKEVFRTDILFRGWNMAENTIFMMLRKKKRLLKCIP